MDAASGEEAAGDARRLRQRHHRRLGRRRRRLHAAAGTHAFPPGVLVDSGGPVAVRRVAALAFEVYEGRGLHSSTSQHDLSRFGHTSPCPPV